MHKANYYSFQPNVRTLNFKYSIGRPSTRLEATPKKRKSVTSRRKALANWLKEGFLNAKKAISLGIGTTRAKIKPFKIEKDNLPSEKSNIMEETNLPSEKSNIMEETNLPSES
jgi:hypothetical protein